MSQDKLGGRKTLAVEGFLQEFEKDEIKRRVDIVSLFDSFGVVLTAKGKGFAGRCPWHHDKEPSLWKTAKGLLPLGRGESGDVVPWCRGARSGLQGSPGVLEGSRGNTSSNGHRDGRRMPRTSVVHPTSDVTVSSERDLRFILDDVAARYAAALLGRIDARAYLASRGRDEAQLITGFKIGYCVGTLADSLSSAQKADLTRLGVLKASEEHFKGCIVVPLLDEQNHVAGFYGRRISANSGPAHLYLPGPHRGLVNRAAAKVYREELILTESIIDALSLIVLGILNVIPCYGVNGFTEEHGKLLRDERVKTVAVGFDSDEAAEPLLRAWPSAW